MTLKEFYTTIANESTNEELVTIATAQLEKMETANARKLEKAAKEKEYKMKHDAPLYTRATEMLEQSSIESPVTASAVALACQISSAKATVILKNLCATNGYETGECKVKGESGSRTVKAYYKA